MPVHVAAFEQRVFAPYCLHRKIQGNVKNLVAALLLQVAQESEIILKMLDHIQNENQLKRSEEHTSELQSRLHLVCRLLLEKKKKEKQTKNTQRTDYTKL